MNLELIVTRPVLRVVKNYAISIPEFCITAILNEIERLDSITAAVAPATASRDEEIREIKEALHPLKKKLEKGQGSTCRTKARGVAAVK